MKKIILKILMISMLVFSNINVFSQVLLSGDKFFKIYLNKIYLIYNSTSKSPINYFTIVNSTNNSYIINIKGFKGKFGRIYKEGEFLKPVAPALLINPAEWDDDECKSSILIIKPGITIQTLLWLDILKDYYKIEDNNYIVDFETEHSLNSPYYYGCKKYVDSLRNKGFLIYEGSLKGKIKLSSECMKE